MSTLLLAEKSADTKSLDAFALEALLDMTLGTTSHQTHSTKKTGEELQVKFCVVFC